MTDSSFLCLRLNLQKKMEKEDIQLFQIFYFFLRYFMLLIYMENNLQFLLEIFPLKNLNQNSSKQV